MLLSELTYVICVLIELIIMIFSKIKKSRMKRNLYFRKTLIGKP
jgi:hypothetical protein